MSAFLESAGAKDTVLWSLSYRVFGPAEDPAQVLQTQSSQIMLFSRRAHDIAFDDTVLDVVKDAWKTIMGNEAAAETSFLRFEEREPELEE